MSARIPQSLKTLSKWGFLIGGGIGNVILGKKIYDTFCRSLSVKQPSPYVPHIPKTVSLEAQEYFRIAVPCGTPPEIKPDFGAIRAGFRAATLGVSHKAREEYVEKVEKKAIAGVPVSIVTPKGYVNPRDARSEKIMIYIHGGAFTLGSHEHLYQIFAPVAHKAGLKTVAVDYRLAPESTFPSGLEDCFAVYKELLKTYRPENVVLLGDSAGGTLVIGTIFSALDAGYPLPRAIGLNSPLVDTEEKSDSFFTLKGKDPKLASYEESIAPSLDVYLPKKEDWENPLVAVIRGDFKRFPPTAIHTGTRDLLLSDGVRLHRALREAGVSSTFEPWEAGWHGFQEHGFPESYDSAEKMGEFFRQQLGKN